LTQRNITKEQLPDVCKNRRNNENRRKREDTPAPTEDASGGDPPNVPDYFCSMNTTTFEISSTEREL